MLLDPSNHFWKLMIQIKSENKQRRNLALRVEVDIGKFFSQDIR